MTVRISPQPTADEREVLLRALAVLDGGRDEPPAWWQAGIREAVEDEPDEKE